MHRAISSIGVRACVVGRRHGITLSVLALLAALARRRRGAGDDIRRAVQVDRHDERRSGARQAQERRRDLELTDVGMRDRVSDRPHVHEAIVGGAREQQGRVRAKERRQRRRERQRRGGAGVRRELAHGAAARELPHLDVCATGSDQKRVVVRERELVDAALLGLEAANGLVLRRRGGGGIDDRPLEDVRSFATREERRTLGVEAHVMHTAAAFALVLGAHALHDLALGEVPAHDVALRRAESDQLARLAALLLAAGDRIGRRLTPREARVGRAQMRRLRKVMTQLSGRDLPDLEAVVGADGREAFEVAIEATNHELLHTTAIATIHLCQDMYVCFFLFLFLSSCVVAVREGEYRYRARVVLACVCSSGDERKTKEKSRTIAKVTKITSATPTPSSRSSLPASLVSRLSDDAACLAAAAAAVAARSRGAAPARQCLVRSNLAQGTPSLPTSLPPRESRLSD